MPHQYDATASAPRGRSLATGLTRHGPSRYRPIRRHDRLAASHYPCRPVQYRDLMRHWPIMLRPLNEHAQSAGSDVPTAHITSQVQLPTRRSARGKVSKRSRGRRVTASRFGARVRVWDLLVLCSDSVPHGLGQSGRVGELQAFATT